MRIVKIDAELSTPPSLDRLRISVHADNDTVGVAEAFLPDRAGALVGRISELVKAKLLIGKNPFDTEALVDQLLLRATGRMGDVESSVVSMVEIACRDLVGRSLGIPVYQLIGGAVRDRIKACAVGWTPADRSPEDYATAAQEQVALGFRLLAFELFGPGTARLDLTPSVLRDAVRLAESVRAAVGPEVELRIDMNARLSPADARRAIAALSRVELVEIADPVRAEDLPLTAEVAVSAGPPLTLRADFIPLLARRGCNTLRIDLARCGGFTEACKIAALAEMHGISVALRNTSGPLVSAAALHLAASLTNLAYVEVAPDPVAPLDVHDGTVALPEGPGLGVQKKREP